MLVPQVFLALWLGGPIVPVKPRRRADSFHNPQP
jgi:hypothetical protein